MRFDSPQRETSCKMAHYVDRRSITRPLAHSSRSSCWHQPRSKRPSRTSCSVFTSVDINCTKSQKISNPSLPYLPTNDACIRRRSQKELHFRRTPWCNGSPPRHLSVGGDSRQAMESAQIYRYRQRAHCAVGLALAYDWRARWRELRGSTSCSRMSSMS